MPKRRSAEPAKSPRRRSPEPFVVRYAAFVKPIPSSSNASCSCGAYNRDVNPAACNRRQKSLRGFAKCAPAAADTRPGLMPQKTTHRFGARMSGSDTYRRAVARRRLPDRPAALIPRRHDYHGGPLGDQQDVERIRRVLEDDDDEEESPETDS